ncbi:MAG: hypothetical protein SFU83_01925 [Meiothermus sp.]|nr:hypothetical protein [Meiothermus sp.]
MPKPVDPADLERAVYLIGLIASKHEEKKHEGLEELVAEYNWLTSSDLSVEGTEHFCRIRTWTEVEAYAEMSLRHVPKVPDVTDEELLEIIGGLHVEARTEAELDYWLTFLEINIPSKKVSDLIYHSEEELTPEQILAKAREWNPIVLYPPGSSS